MHYSRFSLFTGAFFYGLTILIVIGGIGFMAYAVFLLFGRVLPLWGAALATGGILIVFALLLAGLHRIWQVFCSGARGTCPPHRHQGGDLAGLIDPAVLELIRSKPRSAVLVAMVAGTALGASPELRRTVGRFLKNLGTSRDTGGP